MDLNSLLPLSSNQEKNITFLIQEGFLRTSNLLFQGRRENSEAPGQKRKTSPPASESSGTFSGFRN